MAHSGGLPSSSYSATPPLQLATTRLQFASSRPDFLSSLRVSMTPKRNDVENNEVNDELAPETIAFRVLDEPTRRALRVRAEERGISVHEFVRIPGQFGQRFQFISDTESNPNRTPIPGQIGQ